MKFDLQAIYQEQNKCQSGWNTLYVIKMVMN